MSRWIRLSDSRGRDAHVRMVSRRKPEVRRLQTRDGRRVEPARLIKSPLPQTYRALRERCENDTELANLLIESDLEIDLESAGRRVGPTDRVLLDPDGQVLYATDSMDVIYDQTGREIERRTPRVCPANIDDHSPIVWTGKLIPRDDAAKRYAFTRQYQVRHVDGLTHDFLRTMAEELDRTQSLVLIGAGQRGRDPLILERNGTPYRGFLEGRIDGNRYLLILHLTNIELRDPKES